MRITFPKFRRNSASIVRVRVIESDETRFTQDTDTLYRKTFPTITWRQTQNETAQ